MQLLRVMTLGKLKVSIFNDEVEPPAPDDITYVIYYKDDYGNEREYRTVHFSEMIIFIRSLYENGNWNDVREDPRDNKFFQDYMRGDLIPL